jgi:pyruvyl transferase EpsO
MAHMLWGEWPAYSQGAGCLYLMRSDGEAPFWQGDLEFPRTCDWKDLCTDWDLFVSKRRMRQWEIWNASAPFPVLPTRWYWNRHARKLVGRAVALFSAHASVTTSRLHGHLLACLLGKPNTLFDNSYGKNLNYHDTWTFRVKGVKLGAPPLQTAGPTPVQT